MSMQIVSMGRKNLDSCARIVDGMESFHRYGLTGDAIGRMLGAALDEGRSDLRVSRTDDGDVLGLAWLVPRGGFDRSGYLRLIAVDEVHRREGVGRRLVAALEDTHLRHGGIFVLISRDNQEAQQFYESQDYRHTGLLPGYIRPDLDELVFYKTS